jgi:hypothetical protein
VCSIAPLGDKANCIELDSESNWTQFALAVSERIVGAFHIYFGVHQRCESCRYLDARWCAYGVVLSCFIQETDMCGTHTPSCALFRLQASPATYAATAGRAVFFVKCLVSRSAR